MAIAKSNLWALITSALVGIVGSTLATLMFPVLEEYLLIFVVMAIALTGIGLVLGSIIDNINEEQVRLEKEIKNIEGSVEEKIKQIEGLVDVKVESKYLKDRILRIEEIMRDGN